MTKKKTRKDKIKASGTLKPKGKSKYAKKLIRRRKLAHKLNQPRDCPYPLLWLLEED